MEKYLAMNINYDDFKREIEKVAFLDKMHNIKIERCNCSNLKVNIFINSSRFFCIECRECERNQWIMNYDYCDNFLNKAKANRGNTIDLISYNTIINDLLERLYSTDSSIKICDFLFPNAQDEKQKEIKREEENEIKSKPNPNSKLSVENYYKLNDPIKPIPYPCRGCLSTDCYLCHVPGDKAYYGY